MNQYLNLLHDVIIHGADRGDRTGTGTRSVFGRQLRFDLQEGFPLVTTKKVFTKAIIRELLWFLSGSTNVRYLQEHGVRIWDDWADPGGELGPVYGSQWRSWQVGISPTALLAIIERNNSNVEQTDRDVRNLLHEHRFQTIDQISGVIHSIKTNPESRRHIVSAWNPAEVDDMALPPCHTLFQFYVADGRLSCQLYQRSADLFLGVPFNIASYALLTHMIAHVTGLEPGDFVHTFGDAHVYFNHFDQVGEQLQRTPRPLPTLNLDGAPKDIFEIQYEDIRIEGYDPYPAIKAPIAV